MKNGMILTAMLLLLLATGWSVARGPQEGIVEGRFAEEIDPDKRTVYLIAVRDGERKILDSARLAGSTFTLRGAVSRRGDSCRVEFSRSNAGFGLRLKPNTTVRMQIAAAFPAPEVYYLREPDNERTADALDLLPYSERMRILQQRADSLLDSKQ